jgi:hypothetical protein
VFHVFQQVGRFQTLRGDFGGLPSWARLIVFLAALPGIVLGVLSVILFLVTILVLLLLTAPVYRLLRLVCSPGYDQQQVTVTVVRPDSPGSRPVDVKVIE